MWKKILAAMFMVFATAIAMAAVDVNKATEAELDGLKGIGPVTSKLILSERKKGEFKDWQDFIDRVKGVGESRAAKFSAEGLTVNGQAFKAATAKKDEKAATKQEKKEAKAEAKAEKKEAKAEAKADAAKPAASAAKK
ncbi:ComEA family DNA-binding protein [Ramlibacter sp.]|uniref:ComEA family DNA-binding protein n=1 Tax=Ramlibacter sp. TaxID=1917967 RepID=UPI002C24132B|nr:helix-hairpin-helix domain-containing protein [Ramlibacter sp.]HWI83447.1 helix-hairpin-helix domain-containing protein [Ramlibacter sp.]